MAAAIINISLLATTHRFIKAPTANAVDEPLRKTPDHDFGNVSRLRDDYDDDDDESVGR